ncbi:MAG TPA: hypothetical protein VGK67_18230 [Myxococcales bacterium]
MRTLLAAVLLVCCASSPAWAGYCDIGCGAQTRATCLANCAANKEKHTVAVCNAACEDMMSSCKKVCEAAMKHEGKPEQMAAAAKEVLAAKKRR